MHPAHKPQAYHHRGRTNRRVSFSLAVVAKVLGVYPKLSSPHTLAPSLTRRRWLRLAPILDIEQVLAQEHHKHDKPNCNHHVYHNTIWDMSNILFRPLHLLGYF